MQACHLAALESPTCTGELFIRKCGADNLKDDTDTYCICRNRKIYATNESLKLSMEKGE